MNCGKLLNLYGGGDRTRTCIAFRPAVFKTAALPLCDPSALWPHEYSACTRRSQTPSQTDRVTIAPQTYLVQDRSDACNYRSDQYH